MRVHCFVFIKRAKSCKVGRPHLDPVTGRLQHAYSQGIVEVLVAFEEANTMPPPILGQFGECKVVHQLVVKR